MNEEKVAILLLSLDEELAGKVMKNFSPSEIERIGKQMSQLNSVSLEDVNNVAKEFCTLARQKGGVLPVHGDTLRKLIIKAAGEEKAHDILASIARTVGNETPYDNPLIQKLQEIDPQILIDFTRTEHPQTIALILSYVGTEQAVGILEGLSPEMQSDIVKRMSTLKSVPHEFVEDIANTLEKEIIVGGVSDLQPGGVAMVAEILNRMNRNTENTIMKSLDDTIPEIAAEIRKKMFTFEDILKLDDKSIRELLREVTTEDLARALKIVDDEMRGVIFRNMSKRGAEMLKEDIEMMPPIRLSEIEKSQRIILDATRKLEAEGKIVLMRGEGGDQFV
ncbi:MAG: flagellar motor switch protein FliG [Deltaproteobacteria bacterium]|nr:flagellar motor switch protein FliG [Deltaproteobacteria bacterium]